jgi:pimeloyl-ACP methyl ester carboxylesterase
MSGNTKNGREFRRSRRIALAMAAGLPLLPWLSAPAQTTRKESGMTEQPLHDVPDIPGIRRRTIDNGHGLAIRVYEAGHATPGRPAVLLLHGFPETAYSWRKTMLPLADAGYHVIAPDQRGYGHTTGWDGRYDGDFSSFRTHAFARDALGVLTAMGLSSVAAVVGHDFGAMVAAYCALTRPDVFRSLVMMSFPFDGPPPALPDALDAPAGARPPSLDAQLAALPRPRKDSMAYFSTPQANDDMWHAPQGLPDFLRAYYHVKSADWPHNHPHPLATGTAAELATLPTYYIMDRSLGMAETVAPHMPSPARVSANAWLTDEELSVYADAFRRTGFQGGLNWFRCHAGPIGQSEIALFSGRSIDVPALYIAGVADWGSYRKPGALERMRTTTCTRMRGVHFIEGAGHWVQQEQPGRFNRLLLEFLQQQAA